MRVAIFRPDDHRIDEAVTAVEARGWEALPDPLLAVEPTGATPDVDDADAVVFTSVSGVAIALDDGLEPEALSAATVVAIGPATAEALRDRGVAVDVVPDEYSSAGLVEALRDGIEGQRVEVARSDHGAPELLEGLADAGAEVHETVLYRLTRPENGGDRTVAATLDGGLDAAVFTSSLTVEHLLDAAGDRREALVAALDDVLVAAIGDRTAGTARDHGIAVDVVPDEETVDALLDAVAASA